MKSFLYATVLAAIPLLAWPADTDTAPAPTVTVPAATKPAPAAPKPAPAVSAARPAGRAQDRVELENTQITGNRELPRVMYVVPWKRPDLGDLGGKPAKSLLDELLEPVDRDVFQRQNRYYSALRPDVAGKDSAPAEAAAGDEK